MYPVLKLGENLSVPTYYLVITATVCLCLLWLNSRIAKYSVTRSTALDLSLVVMIASFVGARLFHVLYENPEIYLANPERIFYFWDGGFVFYGGALLAGLSGYLFLRWKDAKNLLEYFDLFAPVLALSYSLGRVGCLLAGCCYGRTCELPWSIAGRHPTQIYASLWELGVVFILLGLETVPREKRHPSPLQKKGAIFFVWMVLHGMGRIVMEAFRDDFRGPDLGLSVSTWISVVLILTGLVFLFKPTSRRPTDL